jgi:hypothetical protein
MTPEESLEQKRERRIVNNQKYWSSHREEIAQKRNIKIECSCGKHVLKRHLNRHLESKRHVETKSGEDLSKELPN